MVLSIFWCLMTGVISAIVSAIVYILWYQKYSRFFKLMNKIPSRKGYPIIGTAWSYLNVPRDQVFAHLHKTINEQNYPISKEWSFTMAGVHLLHPDDIEAVLSSTKNNDKGLIYYFLKPWLGSGLLTSTRDKWHKRRKILTPSFHFKILQEFLHVFNAGTEDFVDILKEECDKPFTELTELVTEYTLKSIAETAMGIDYEQTIQYSNYKKAIHEFSEGFSYRLFRPWYYPYQLFLLCSNGRTTRAAVKILHNFSKNVIRERKKNFSLPGQDFKASKRKLAMLDILLKAQQEGEDIDDEGIREEVDTFMFEGHDTSAMAISSLLFLMANHKDVQEKLHNEIVQVLGDRVPKFDDFKELLYMDMCIKEGLRLFPSVHTIGRVATSDIKVPSGYTIPKNASINIFPFNLHRNPELWPDPEKFDPDRFLPEAAKNRHPFAYIPFSAGQRNCIGQRFALLEMKAVLCGVLRKYRLEPIEAHTDLVMAMGITLRPIDGYKVKFKLR